MTETETKWSEGVEDQRADGKGVRAGPRVHALYADVLGAPAAPGGGAAAHGRDIRGAPDAFGHGLAGSDGSGAANENTPGEPDQRGHGGGGDLQRDAGDHGRRGAHRGTVRV